MAFETDSAGTVGLRYTWGLGTDDLVAVRDASGNHYYVTQDRLHSVRGLVKRSDGSWVRSLRYGPYGAVVTDTAASGAPTWELRYRWTGREYDAETGFYFHRSRYYDARVRRFVQEDKIGYAGGSNLFAYVGGRVLEARDPMGLDELFGTEDFGACFVQFWQAASPTGEISWGYDVICSRRAAGGAGGMMGIGSLGGSGGGGGGPGGGAGGNGAAGPGVVATQSRAQQRQEPQCRNVLGGHAQVQRTDVPSGFGDRGGTHQGVDILAPLGTDVTAFDAGAVVSAGWNDYWSAPEG